MDDMKKLVEKYKRELMEYSKTAAVPEKLSFPEMLPEEPPAPPAEQPAPEPQIEELPSAPQIEEQEVSEPAKSPRIIGYSDDQSALNSLEKYLSDLGQTDTQPISEEPQPQDLPDDFTTLPPQFTGDVPQEDFTGEAVSPENNNLTDAVEPEPPSQFQPEGELTTGQPGEAENIGQIPESGQFPGEQLTGRSFESQQLPANSREDVKPLVQTDNGDFRGYVPEPEYNTLDEFMKANPQQGSLRFRTYTARNALPVPNANISVTKMIGGRRHIFYNLTTDSSGQTDEVILPAPSYVYSQTADSAIQPFSLYDADITAKGFEPVSVRNLPVFEGILSVQRAALVPGAGNRRETITEEEPDLTEVRDAR